MENRKEIARYCRQVRNWLPCGKNQKARVMEEFGSSIEEFLEGNPDAGMTELYAHFGEPQAVAAAYLEGMDSPEVLQKLHVRRMIVKIVAAASAVALTAWLLVVAWAVYDEQNDSNGFLIEGNITASSYITEG